MASSVPIHPIRRGRPGVELGPRRSCQLPAGGRPRKSQERQSPQGPRGGGQARQGRGRGWCVCPGPRLPPIPSPVHSLQGPERGLHSEKEYSRSWGFLFVFF